ncbi:SRPBCC family protein [Amaricoccus sp.]|uniref:SRPBCC family protein n=1 Tax=Amaricoccus sp. TaxID=1872485 RepID=UPI001B5829FE|nr:SRPBCC family protein [Amaricoccus sp.]MBP7003265.1 SRPBCC family protein [Amaricoccus sp.]
MAKAYASTVIDAPVEAVWEVVRDFNGLPAFLPAIPSSEIEEGLPADAVGCVRAFRIGETLVRERLLALDDCRYRLVYNFETPAFPVANYRAKIELIPVTAGDRTFAQWFSYFDEAPGDEGKYVEIISRDVFGGGLAALKALVAGRAAPEGAQRWKGLRPAKVFTTSVIDAPVGVVWERMRDFAGMDGWHEDITRMRMLDGARPDRLGGVREFLFGTGLLHEELTFLSDEDRAFRYRILKSEMPWLNYHAGARLYPVSDGDRTLGLWTADWTASPQDDLALIPAVQDGVFQKAFDTLAAQLGRGA